MKTHYDNPTTQSRSPWLQCFIVAVIALTGTVAFATPIAISNPSFENPTGSAPNGVGDPPNGSIGAWNYTRTGVLASTLTDVTFGPSALATDGTNVATMNFLVGVLANETLSQDLGVPLLPNSVYTLRFDADQASIVSLLTNASAAITAGGVPVASLNNAALLGLLNGAGPLHPVTLHFTTGAVAPSGNLGIAFQIGGVVQALGSGLVLDNVRMDVAPAPIILCTSIPVSNPSFENPTGSAPNGIGDPPNGSIGAWNYTRTGVLASTLTDVTFGPSALATDGTMVATMNFLVGVLASETLFQDLGVPLQPHSVYTLKFDADQASIVSLLTNASASITAGGAPVAALNNPALLGLLDGAGPLNPVSFQFITGATPPSGNLGVAFQIGGVVQALGSGLLLDNLRMCGTPALVPSVVSRKMHGAAGIFDINLPLTGNPGIECRTGGANGDFQMVMNFPSPVTLTSASVTTGTGSVVASGVSGSQVTVDLTGVANVQTIVVTLFGVSDGVNTGDVHIPMGVLLGDTNANRVVNASDIGQTKNRSGQTTGAANFRSDVNANGVINASDIGTVNMQSGTGLP